MAKKSAKATQKRWFAMRTLLRFTWVNVSLLERSNKMLEISNLSAAYGMVQILYDVNFKVEEREIVSIIGPNGAGKTTLVKTIMGVMHPKTGFVKFKGENIEKLPTYEIVKKGLTMIPEGREIFPRMTVEENLQLGAYTIKDKTKVKEA